MTLLIPLGWYSLHFLCIERLPSQPEIFRSTGVDRAKKIIKI